VAVVAVVDARWGKPVASSRRRRLADGGDARHRPLVAGERKKESEERVREREERVGEVGSPVPDFEPPFLFVPFSFFFLFFDSS